MLQFVNNFRGIAILLVVLNHAFRGVEHDFFLTKILYAILDNVTVLFVVVAGYLFSVISKDFNFLSYLKNKVLMVLLPYLFISTPAALLYLLKMKTEHWWIDMEWFYSQLNIIEQYFYLMSYGAHLGPFWFVPMIILFYFLSPILYLLSKNNGALFLVFLPSLAVSIYLGRPEYNENPFFSLLFFMPAYLFGMLLKSNPDLYSGWGKSSTFVLLLGLFISGCFYHFYGELASSSVDIVIKLLFSLVGFSCCYTLLNCKVKWLDLFARLSFFLYFIHGYFAAIIAIVTQKLDLAFCGPAALFWLVIFFIVIVFLSLSAFVVAKVIFKDKSKFFVAA